LIASQVELQITQRASHAPSTPREKRAGDATVPGRVDDSVFIRLARYSRRNICAIKRENPNSRGNNGASFSRNCGTIDAVVRNVGR